MTSITTLLQQIKSWWLFKVVGQAGWVGLGVIGILIILSIFSWAIMIDKFFQYRHLLKRNRRALDSFRRLKSDLRKLGVLAREVEVSPFGSLIETAYKRLHRMFTAQPLQSTNLSAYFEEGLKLLEEDLFRTINQEQLKIEKFVTWLATTAYLAPFLGLFGTVWGITKAFYGMSLSGNASIASVAPGLAEALTTTVAGLACAIPAVAGYNWCRSKIDKMVREMEIFASELINFVREGLAQLRRQTTTGAASASATSNPSSMLQPDNTGL